MPRVKGQPKKHFTARLSTETLKQINELAEKQGRSQADIIEIAVEFYKRLSAADWVTEKIEQDSPPS